MVFISPEIDPVNHEVRFWVEFDNSDGDVLPGLRALLTEAARVAQHGFTETELARTKIDVLRSMERTHAERDKIDSRRFAGEYVRHFIENEPFPGIPAEFELYNTLVPTVTVSEVNPASAALSWIGCKAVASRSAESASRFWRR